MGRDDSFFEKNKGKIGIAGLAVNALQNQQIAKRQKALAQLQAKTAQLQKEENDLKKKEIELLKKEQESLKEEKKKREELTGELLNITPKLSQLLEKIQNSDYQSEFQRGKDLYKASCVLAYIDSRKDVIKDINFHDYLSKLNNKLSSSIHKHQKCYEVFDSYMKDMDLFVDENRVTISTIGRLINNYRKGDKYDFNKLEKELKKIRDENSHRELLLEELRHYHSVLFKDNLFTDAKYVSLPLSEKQSETLIYFLENISDQKFFEDEIIYQLDTLKANHKIEQLAQELEGKEIYKYIGDCDPLNLPEIRSILKKVKLYNIDNEFVDSIIPKLKEYKNHIGKVVSGASRHDKTYMERLKYTVRITGIAYEKIIMERLGDVMKKNELSIHLTLAVLGVLVVFIIIAGFMIDSGRNISQLVLWGSAVEILLLIKLVSVSTDKTEDVENIIKPYSNKVDRYFQDTINLLTKMKS
ncbi:hypothetical protein [Fodinibius salsisoli]|uniref:Uncharacterized protein n=1 Tax=Fodinibius salsisoli TaxID=2820877 RepID=A0ABT3PJ56_9BACT|nr:hypothetical protein [Fodinibius salsisoli]MCW9705808.1 hypothetical protein [Fodinibius salsisoli]